MRRLSQVVLAVTLLALAGCPKKAMVNATPPPDAGTALQIALDDIAARRFQKAQDGLTFLIFNYPGSAQAADAQYYLAESYFVSRNYSQAETEYDFYIKSFPNGRFQEEALLKLAMSNLRSAPGFSRDQTKALKARELIDQFNQTYPESQYKAQADSISADVDLRLAGKELDAARLYYKSGEYGSALVYFEYVKGAHPLARWSDDDRLRLGICYQEAGRTDEARAVFNELLAGTGTEPVKRQARERLSRIH